MKTYSQANAAIEKIINKYGIFVPTTGSCWSESYDQLESQSSLEKAVKLADDIFWETMFQYSVYKPSYGISV